MPAFPARKPRNARVRPLQLHARNALHPLHGLLERVARIAPGPERGQHAVGDDRARRARVAGGGCSGLGQQTFVVVEAAFEGRDERVEHVLHPGLACGHELCRLCLECADSLVERQPVAQLQVGETQPRHRSESSPAVDRLRRERDDFPVQRHALSGLDVVDERAHRRIEHAQLRGAIGHPPRHRDQCRPHRRTRIGSGLERRREPRCKQSARGRIARGLRVERLTQQTRHTRVDQTEGGLEAAQQGGFGQQLRVVRRARKLGQLAHDVASALVRAGALQRLGEQREELAAPCCVGGCR